MNPGIAFLLCAKRDKQAARRFFRQALGRANTRTPRTIVADRLTSYPGALRAMKRDGELGRFTRHRRGRWLNNRVEQDHRRIKRRTRPRLGFQSFRTARRTLAGVEAMAMLAKGRVRGVPGADLPAQRAFVTGLFGLAAGAAQHRAKLNLSTSMQQIRRLRTLGFRSAIAVLALPRCYHGATIFGTLQRLSGQAQCRCGG